MDVLEVMRGIGSVDALRAAVEQGVAPVVRPKVNSHVHLPPNFSAFSTVKQVVDLAAEQQVRVLGVTNYYDFRVYGEIASLAREARVFPLFGLEIISLVDELVRGGVKINDPGNPGRMYLCGKGVTRFDPIPSAADTILQTIRSNDTTRMRQMIQKAAAVLAAAGVDLGVTEANVRAMVARRHGCSDDLVYLQERHIAQALQESLFATVAEEGRTALLAKVYGSAPKAAVNDAVKTQNELRSNLLKSGKAAFVEESFVSDAEARRMILSMGGIVCYPVLADGASPLCPYEQTPQTLIRHLQQMNVPMAEFIPVRNSPEVLEAYVRAMRDAGIAVVGGTEHNTLDLIPLEPTCAKGADVPERVREIFWEGACVVAAHQFLQAHGETGFVDEEGRPASGHGSADERIRAFAKLGAAVIAEYLK